MQNKEGTEATMMAGAGHCRPASGPPLSSGDSERDMHPHAFEYTGSIHHR